MKVCYSRILCQERIREVRAMTIREEIEQLKKEKNAVILAHYYVRPEVQEIADYVGDSFYLSKVAVGLKEKTIVFCGVSFMGESAKILNPEKTVLMPDMAADCPMAHMASAETIEKIRSEYDDLAVVCYINSTAELKRHSDVCVTSSNAVKIVKALPNKNIFFIPDRNLAHVRQKFWNFLILLEVLQKSSRRQENQTRKNLSSVQRVEFCTNFRRETRRRNSTLQRQLQSAEI